MCPPWLKHEKQVLEIRRPRQHSTSGGGQQCRKRRQTLQTVVLECAAGTTAGRLNPRQQQRRPTGNVGFGAEDGGGGDSSSNNSSSRETVLLHLWDEQTCLTSLFRKGDGLVVYWPWLVQQQQPHAQSGDVVLDPAAAMGARAPSQQQSLSSQVRNSIHERRCNRVFRVD